VEHIRVGRDLGGSVNRNAGSQEMVGLIVIPAAPQRVIIPVSHLRNRSNMRYSSAAALAAAVLLALTSACGGSSQSSASVTLCHDFLVWTSKSNITHDDPAADHTIGHQYEHLHKDASKAVRHWVARSLVFFAFMTNDSKSGASYISDSVSWANATFHARTACKAVGVSG
jgi:hypothetical protein